MRADFLLNFQRPPANQRPQQAHAAPPRRARPAGRQSSTVAFVKGRFVQSCFRVLVEETTPDVVQAAFDADSLVDWSSVRQVDLVCDQPPKCPICLDVDIIVPRITKCGHIFCAPCVMRYFLALKGQNGKTWQRCPVCNETVGPEELTHVQFQFVQSLRENDTAAFVLAHREANSTVVRTSFPPQSPQGQRRDGEAIRLPSPGEGNWRLSRLVRFRPGDVDRLMSQELEALRAYRAVAAAEGEADVLPGTDAAKEQLQRRLRERRKDDGGVSGAGASAAGLMLPAAAVDEDAEFEADEMDAGGRLPPAVTDSPALGPDLRTGSDTASPASAPAASPELGPLPTSQEGACGGRAAGGTGGAPHKVSFYQLADGRLVFLQPFFMRLLLHEHGGNWGALPSSLPEVKIERLQEVTVTEELRKRHRFLSHLPLGSPISFAEVDLRAHLSRETKEHFAEEFLKRQQQRRKDQAREKKQERISKARAAEDEERYYNALNLTHPTVIQAPPTKEDFAATLPGRRSSNEGAADGDAGEACELDGVAEDAEENAGPTLAEKLKEKMAAKARPKDRQRRPAGRGFEGSNFPQLGDGGSGSGVGGGTAVGPAATGPSRGTPASSASAWGKGRGSDRVPGAAAGPAAASAWGEGAAGGAVPAAAPADPAAEDWEDLAEPTFGEALEAALQRATASSAALASAAPCEPAEAAATAAAAAAVEPEAEATEVVAPGGKKKKGRAAKATTIRLFG